MIKFNVGDIVTPTTDWLKGLNRGKKYKIEDIAGPRIRVEGTSLYYNYSVFKIAEPEFKNGDEVEVSDFRSNWKTGLYIGKNPLKNRSGHFVLIGDKIINAMCYSYCRHPRKEYTLKECADALGVPVDEFRIKDE